MTRPTAEQIQRACDLANAVNGAGYRVKDYSNAEAFTALADTLAELDDMRKLAKDFEATVISMKAERDKARADLGEIDALLEGQPPINSSLTDAQAIAATYRVETDPLVTEAKAIVDKHAYTYEGLRKAVAEALKRGLEIGRSA